jgi:hypothetical protein
VPLALRATLVNGADFVKDQDENWLYQRINRVKLAPQGICVLDSTGRVLTWVQMFDSNESVLGFLDYCRKRFQENAPTTQSVVTERYMRFSSEKVADFRDEAKIPVIAKGHPKGKTCPAKHAKGAIPQGAVVAQLVGRALDDQGKPVADIVNQEHYVEDQFTIPPQTQVTLAEALANAGKGRIRLPDPFGKLCATYAHLGHLDVRPIFDNGDDQNRGEWRQCEFWAEKTAVGQETNVWRVQGESEIVSEVAINGKGVHDVKLAWEGFIEVKGRQMTRLILSAWGKEKLQFAKDDHPLRSVKRDEVVFLPGGRPIDLQCGVRYGILGEPVRAEDASDAEDVAGAMIVAQVPDEARRQLSEVLGGPFMVFRDKVQEELKLSDEQKQRLLRILPGHIQATVKFFEAVKDQRPEEREQQLQSHRRKSHEKLLASLKDLLQPTQLNRLQQLLLQQEGPFILMGPSEAAGKLKITGEQRLQFQAFVKELQEKIQPLINEAQSGGNPAEIRPKVMKIRKEYAGKMETILTDGQRGQWKEMLGKAFELGDDS